MNYAVIKTGGKLYKVSQGETIEVDRLQEEQGGKVIFGDVLLLVGENSVKIGKPFINGEKVEGKIISHFKGDKIRVSKFKSKVRYRRVTGFRASLSKVVIEKLSETKKESKGTVKKVSNVKKKL